MVSNIIDRYKLDNADILVVYGVEKCGVINFGTKISFGNRGDTETSPERYSSPVFIVVKSIKFLTNFASKRVTRCGGSGVSVYFFTKR